MSKRRRQTYSGCSVESHRGQLRLRFRVRMPDGPVTHVSRATGYADTSENRAALHPLATLVGAAIDAGKTLAEIDQIIARPPRAATRSNIEISRPPPSGLSLAGYYRTWIAEQTPLVRKAQRLDYKRHLTGYVLPTLGRVALADLKPADVRGLQAELLARGLSTKYAKNIIAGSFRALIQQARADELVARDLFAGLKWPTWNPPKPNPFSAEERDRILGWFRDKRFRCHDEGTTGYRLRGHPAFHAFVHALFWAGLRPSEAAGLQWTDIDLPRERLYIRRSRHLYEYGEPKTRSARRTVELFPETVRLLRVLQPLRVMPETPVFTNLIGRPIEPQAFCYHWYECLRALGIRQRGLYCTKDTFITTALSASVKIAWLETQTGVSYATLRRHYGEWMPTEGDSELRRFEAFDPTLFGVKEAKLSPTAKRAGGQSPVRLRSVGGLEMVPRGFEPLLPT